MTTTAGQDPGWISVWLGQSNSEVELDGYFGRGFQRDFSVDFDLRSPEYALAPSGLEPAHSLLGRVASVPGDVARQVGRAHAQHYGCAVVLVRTRFSGLEQPAGAMLTFVGAFQTSSAPSRSRRSKRSGRPAPGTPLWRAALSNDLATLGAEIANGADVDERVPDGGTALLAAARLSHPEAVRALIAAGASVHAVDPFGQTALHLAVSKPCGSDQEAMRALKCVELLLEAGVPVDAVGPRDGTPLMVAAWFGWLGVAQHLIDVGANSNAVNASGQTARELAVERGHTDVAALLGHGVC